MNDHLPPVVDVAAAAADHARMVAQLRRPGACGGHPDASGLIETHISSLLLADGQVYKLKKPVALAFVDFSTVALRREACEQELRLNRRTAPRWYLGLVPVQQGPDGAFIAAPGTVAEGAVLDWAVRMRRFDDRQLFDRMAREGRLGHAQVDSLAAVVAQFHGRLGPAPPGFGRAALTRHEARQNLAELAALVQGSAMAENVAALQPWTETRGAVLAALMDMRCRTGHVREVHGDLHLGNIVWDDGSAVLFDALEFNELLRHIDTLGDLAFPFMDLLAHGQPRLAWRFIGAALEAEGDWAALPLLAWWAVYRAAVRAKVALLGAPRNGSADGAAQARAARYLSLAAQLSAPARPLLVAMMGLSGSGKTAVAGQLAELLGGVRLRSDVERKRLFGLPPTGHAGPALGMYSPDATLRTYERLQELAAGALNAGVSVVVDAASLRRAERDALRALAQRLHADFRLVCCSAPPAVLLARVVRRQAVGQDASDATPEVLAMQQKIAEWPAEDEAEGLVRLDTDRPPAALAQAVDALAQRAGWRPGAAA